MTARGWNKWGIYNRSSILVRAVGTRNVPCRTNKHFSEDPDSCSPQNSLCMQRFLVFRKYYYVDQTKESEMDDVCRERVLDEKCISNFSHKTWRKNVRLCVRIMSALILKQCDQRVSSEFIWLRMEPSGSLSCIWQRTPKFHKRQKKNWCCLNDCKRSLVYGICWLYRYMTEANSDWNSHWDAMDQNIEAHSLHHPVR
jgi:hypothetical protein